MKKKNNIAFGSFKVIIIGLVMITLNLMPILEKRTELRTFQAQWEQVEHIEELEDSSIIAVLTFHQQALPIRLGIDEGILSRGIGVERSLIGQSGNTVLYGHREQFFWRLQVVEIGDTLTIEKKNNYIPIKSQN